MAEKAVPGVCLAELHGGEAVQLSAYGVRNAATGESVGVRTVFEAASLSKPVFAYAVLRLVDAGQLSLDEPLATEMPGYVRGDPRADAITARHVLMHMTGLPNWRSDRRPFRTYFAPGDRFSYSGEGFVYLQHVIERRTGEPLDTVMRRLVFAPLQMTDSSLVWQTRFDADYADPHDGTPKAGAKLKPAAANAAYSLQTTAADYARFVQAALAGTQLDPSTAKLWLTPVVNVPKGRFESLEPEGAAELDRRVAWGLGWGLEPEEGTFFHWGSNDGFTAYAIGSQALGKGLVMFTNGDNGLSLAAAIVEAVLPGPRPSLTWLGYLPEP